MLLDREVDEPAHQRRDGPLSARAPVPPAAAAVLVAVAMAVRLAHAHEALLRQHAEAVDGGEAGAGAGIDAVGVDDPHAARPAPAPPSVARALVRDYCVIGGCHGGGGGGGGWIGDDEGLALVGEGSSCGFAHFCLVCGWLVGWLVGRSSIDS